MSDFPSASPIRILALLEGTTVTGPAKNLIEFFRTAEGIDSGNEVSLEAAVFLRTENTRPGALPAPNQLLDAAKAIGLEVHAIPERFPFDPRVITHLRQLVARLNPDIIQTHFVKSHFLVRLSGVWKTRRWVAFHHGYTRDATRTLFYNQLDRWSLRAPCRIITVCEPFKKQVVSMGVPSSRITVLHNAVSEELLERSGQEKASAEVDAPDDGQRTVVAVGRLSEEKAFGDLLLAMDELRRLRPDLLIRLMIVGDGPERTRLERAILELNLQDRVSLPGHVRDVRPYYRMADVLAISSISEGSPNVLLEAMAAGLPVVATAVGGIPEIVTDGDTGLLVGPRQVHKMALSIDRLLSDPGLAHTLARNASRLILTRHSPQSRARCLLDTYRQVFEDAPPR